jgi:glucan phosphorylase
MFGERPEGPAVTDDVLRRKLPRRLVPLRDLALDLRWTWSHGADFLWRRLDPEAWERLENPWALLQDVSNDRLRKAARDSEFIDALERLEQESSASARRCLSMREASASWRATT